MRAGRAPSSISPSSNSASFQRDHRNGVLEEGEDWEMGKGEQVESACGVETVEDAVETVLVRGIGSSEADIALA